MSSAARRALDACYEFAAFALEARDARVEEPDFAGKLDVLEGACRALPEADVRKWMEKHGPVGDRSGKFKR